MARRAGKRPLLPKRWHLFLSAWIPALLWAALIFYVSSLPGDRLHRLWAWAPSYIILHSLEYLILGALVYRAFALTRPALGYDRLALFSWSATAVYAFSDEFHQSFVPLREAAGGDILADLLGAIIGVILFHQFFKRYERIRGKKKA